MTRRAATLAKNLALFLLSLTLSAAVLEATTLIVYRHYFGRAFSRDHVQGRLLRERVGAPDEGGDGSAEERLDKRLDALKNIEIPDHNVIIHPYYGFIVNPESPGINRFGFFEDEPFTQRGPDRFVIAIFGGSLADQVFYLGKNAMAERLRGHAPFRDKDIQIVSVALGGYKQPQQMIILSDLLAHGAQYDAVVNIDGFNEVDSSLDNHEDGLNPFYPHNWKLHARQGVDTDVVARVGRIEIVREKRRDLRALFARFPLYHSVFFLTLWDILDHRYLVALRQQMADLDTRLSSRALPPRVRGPALAFADSESLYREIALVWARSSVQMARLCEAYGTAYFHFLQPNQYVPDSKPFTEEERRVALAPDYSGAERVPAVFPYFQERAGELRELGVNFFDLTGVFKNERRTIYSDFCCHVNQLGADLIAAAIADEIAEHYQADDDAP
jgi:hypothetical protein